MKRTILFTFTLFLLFSGLRAQVGIGEQAPDTKLHLKEAGLSDNTDTSLLKLEATYTQEFLDQDDIIGIQMEITSQANGVNYMPFAMNGEGDILIGLETQKVAIGKNNPAHTLDVEGYSAATNMITTIPLWQAGSAFSMTNPSGSDLSNCEAGIIPNLYSANGSIDLKLVIRVTSSSGNNNFQLRAHDGTTEVFPIVSSDTWTWSNTQTGHVVSSEWKQFNGGTNAWEVHLFGWTTGNAQFNSAYLLVRPHQ